MCLIYDDKHIVRHTLHWHNLLLIRGHEHTLYHCVQLWLVFLILITVHVVSPRLRPCRGELFWWVASSELCRRKMWADEMRELWCTVVPKRCSCDHTLITQWCYDRERYFRVKYFSLKVLCYFLTLIKSLFFVSVHFHDSFLYLRIIEDEVECINRC